MKEAHPYRLSLRVHGSIVLCAALFHGAWHWFFPTYTALDGLTAIQWNTLFLFNWSIALCLLFLSILSLVVSSIQSLTLRQLRMFSVGIISFWAGRLALECLFPLRIPFVIIPNPSLFIKVLLVAIITVLALPELQTQLRRKRVPT